MAFAYWRGVTNSAYFGSVSLCRELDGHLNGGFHAASVSIPRPGKIERRAVVYRRSGKGQAQRDVHGTLKPQRFEHRQTLVMIHRKVGIGCNAHGGDKGAVSGEWAFDMEAALAKRLTDWGDCVDLLRAEVPAFSRVGVETQHRHGGLADAKAFN